MNRCQSRPQGMSIRQWLMDNGINEKSYYYWQRKFRREAYDTITGSPTDTIVEHKTDTVSFAEIQLPSQMPVVEAAPDAMRPAAVIRTSSMTVMVSNDIQESILSLLLEACHA